MNIWLITLVSFVILTLVLSRINIYIDLRFRRKSGDDYLEVSVYLFRRLILYTLQIPLIELINQHDLLWLKSQIRVNDHKEESMSDREQRFTSNLIVTYLKNPGMLRRILQTIKRYSKLYNKFMNRLLESIYCEKLDLHLKYGLGDAAATGVTLGLFWTLAYTGMVGLYNRIHLTQKPVINIIPFFHRECLEVEFWCILRLRLGNVISATTSILNISNRKEV
ncbi:MAG TPA: DUF2953 domain-containing protein [Methylomusa anaerophila]|uniref:DUF2953 domain-containing protein n=1 Tax=Methylomusa anaerophila TaxID=1930071 RepID=A0A348APF9_9FIRM|nr:DUF2953 domain-containing protein [Methylomusa anaerophila]BBB92957.1 hypothetical protein MAMMFC1_03665 [Methylomusa anaerophila]HML87209.1 DUF2953 domain-containing protein [Methylomusa anaerophila]